MFPALFQWILPMKIKSNGTFSKNLDYLVFPSLRPLSKLISRLFIGLTV
jgi:hypothetical protein